MAIGTTNISMSQLYGEHDKDAVTDLSFRHVCNRLHNYGADGTDLTSMRSDIEADNFSMGAFSGASFNLASGGNLVFRFDPFYGYDTYEQGESRGATTNTGHNNATNTPVSPTNNSVGNSIYDLTGTDALLFDSTLGSGEVFTLPASGSSATWVFFFKPSVGSGFSQYNIMDTLQEVEGSTDSAFLGTKFDHNANGSIRAITGDGTGTASSDRRTYTSATGVIVQDEWNAIGFVLEEGDSSVNATTGNWCYHYDVSSDTVTSSCSNVSGSSSGAIAYTFSATADQDTLMVGAGGSVSRYQDTAMGHILVFNGRMTSTEFTDLMDGLKGYYI